MCGDNGFISCKKSCCYSKPKCCIQPYLIQPLNCAPRYCQPYCQPYCPPIIPPPLPPTPIPLAFVDTTIGIQTVPSVVPTGGGVIFIPPGSTSIPLGSPITPISTWNPVPPVNIGGSTVVNPNIFPNVAPTGRFLTINTNANFAAIPAGAVPLPGATVTYGVQIYRQSPGATGTISLVGQGTATATAGPTGAVVATSVSATGQAFFLPGDSFFVAVTQDSGVPVILTSATVTFSGGNPF